MKKSLLALAALTAFAGVASAQSSVTLFGVVDLAARNVKNGGSAGAIKSLSTDGMGSSRLGFRGVEDLGGGLRAGFHIEGSIQADVGGGAKSAANALGSGVDKQDWQRRATVSLMGGFGELRLGRDYTPTFWNHTVFDPFGTNGVGSQTNIQSTAGSAATTLVRASNSIGYFLPAMGGLYGQVMVAAGEGQNGNKYIGGRLGYAAGPINVAGAYGKTELVGPDLKAMNIGASWNLGFMTLMGQYHKYELGNNEQENALLGAVIPMGASTIKASYGKTGMADQVALGYLYSLSKRTTLYTHFSRVSNDGLGRYTASNSGAAISATAREIKSTGYEFGVNHTF